MTLDRDEQELHNRIQVKVGPVDAERIMRFGRPGAAGDGHVEGLSPQGRRELRAWIREVGPVGRYVTRHTRETLRRYQSQGILCEPIATREVQAVTVEFTATEQRLYDQLDDLLDRLMAAHGSKRGAGFVVTVYRRRLRSSWAAISRTLRRRLAKEQRYLEDEDLLDEAEDLELDTGERNDVDDAEVLPLTDADLAEIDHT